MNAKVGVEVYGDCPLIDPVIVDMIIENFLNDENDLDFVGNNLKTTFPPGMEVEVFKVSALEDVAGKVADPAIREHGTLYIRQNPSIFKVKNVEAPVKWHRPELELEVDTEEDIYVVSQIFEYFRALNNENFGIDDIIEFMDGNPDLKKINFGVPRRWKETRGEDNV
tara:strand:- start:99 stop:599 length:501 start_codon:yes stop_codon:yes gene_type:complete